jgi:hypothetical protein
VWLEFVGYRLELRPRRERSDLAVLIELDPAVTDPVDRVLLEHLPRDRLLKHLAERGKQLVPRSGRERRPPRGKVGSA